MRREEGETNRRRDEPTASRLATRLIHSHSIRRAAPRAGPGVPPAGSERVNEVSTERTTEARKRRRE